LYFNYKMWALDWSCHFGCDTFSRLWSCKVMIMSFNMYVYMCYNLSFGLATKARAFKVAGQEWSPIVTFHAPKSVGKCEGMNPTLPNEFPLWELESQWTFESLEGDCKGQNSMDIRVSYIIGKFLEHRCLKWACMTHLGT
jgi:hypothetical protein